MPYYLSYVPIAAAWLTVISLYAANAYKTPINDLWIPLAACSVFAVFLLVVYWVIPQTRKAAPLLSAVSVIMFLMWMEFPETYIPVSVILITIVLTYKADKALIHRITKAAGLIALFGVVASSGMAFFNQSERVSETPEYVFELSETPDIYFIVPDRMPSPASMIESGIDPAWFVNELESLGFYVNPDAMSLDPILPDGRGVQTTRTLRFLTSVLNMGREVELTIPYNEASRAVKYNQVAQILIHNGYEYHHIGSWYPETATSPLATYNYVYDYNYPGKFLFSSLFSTAVIDRSIIRYFNLLGGETTTLEYGRALYQREVVMNIPESDNPQFVFAHILMPHPAFVFKADGTPQEPGRDDFAANVEQIEYAMTYLIELIKGIPEDAVIIIQADEGMAFVNRDYNKQLSLVQWNGVLSAWRGVSGDIPITHVLKELLEKLK